MSTLIVVLLGLLIRLSISQGPYHEIELGTGETCKGESGSLALEGLPNKQIVYDLSSLYNPYGYLFEETGYNKSIRLSVCGHITSSAEWVDSCGSGPDQWCFVIVENNPDQTCLAGIAKWEQSTTTGSLIQYAALFDSMNASNESAIGIRATVLDWGQWGNITCSNGHSIINYYILCDKEVMSWSNITMEENATNCDWNVTMRSRYGCFDIIDWSPGSSGSGISNLSVGSVFLIISIVLLLTYCILGCAYNSFYHGRVGMDAVPNKDRWTQFGRYTRAGCECSRDTLCCSSNTGSYQEL